MEIELAGETALVTGGARGLGRACAEALASAGARVAVADIDAEGAQRTAEAVGGVALTVDLADPDQVVALAGRAEEALGGVDLLIHNAGIVSFRPEIAAVTTEEWDRVIDVNLRAPFILTRELLGPMKARRRGRILFFSSLSARAGAIEAAMHYVASKAGLLGLARSLAKEAGPYGITVNALAPGVMATEPVLRQFGQRGDDFAAGIPLRRLGEARDVAGAVLFFCSTLADYVTGVVLDINGGLFIG